MDDVSKKQHNRPGRKRMGTEVFVPVTMKLEPSDLAMIEAIAKASHRSRSDVMREMLSYGLSRMMETAFAPKDETVAARRDGVAALVTEAEAPAPQDEPAVTGASPAGHTLTATQAAVLGLMRRQPPVPTGQIARELGISLSAVSVAYHELAALGLAFKDGGRWRAVPPEGRAPGA